MSLFFLFYYGAHIAHKVYNIGRLWCLWNTLHGIHWHTILYNVYIYISYLDRLYNILADKGIIWFDVRMKDGYLALDKYLQYRHAVHYWCRTPEAASSNNGDVFKEFEEGWYYSWLIDRGTKRHSRLNLLYHHGSVYSQLKLSEVVSRIKLELYRKNLLLNGMYGYRFEEDIIVLYILKSFPT